MMMCNIFQFCLLSCLVIFASSNETGEDDDPLLKSAIDGTGSEIRRHLATIPGRRLGRLNRNPSKEEIDALRKSLEGLDPSEWNRFSKPHNENVDGMDCFVEVQMVSSLPSVS